MRRLVSVVTAASMLLLGCSTGADLQPSRAAEAYDTTSHVAFDSASGTLIYDGRLFLDTYLYTFESDGSVRKLTDNDDGDIRFSGKFLDYRNSVLYINDGREVLAVNSDTGNYIELGEDKAPAYGPARTLDGTTYVMQSNTVVRWNSEPNVALEPVTGEIGGGISVIPSAANDSYYVTGSLKRPDIFQLQAYQIGDLSTSSPKAILNHKASRIAVTEDSRCLIMADDELTIWDIESGDVTSIDSVNATYSVFVLENGLIMTSGRDERKTFGDPDAVNMTRFWDPQTLEEIATLEGMRVKAMTPMEEGQVAFVVELDDPEAMRGEGATKYRVEVWDLDTITE